MAIDLTALATRGSLTAADAPDVAGKATRGRMPAAPPVSSLYYSYDIATLSNATGATIEAQVRVNTSDSGANKGSALSICDGSFQFILWLRADGLNIDGQADVAMDLATTAHRIKFSAIGDSCRVWVDDQLRQTGTYANVTALQRATFGSWTKNS